MDFTAIDVTLSEEQVALVEKKIVENAMFDDYTVQVGVEGLWVHRRRGGVVYVGKKESIQALMNAGRGK
jgi:hypothetical protein